MMTSNDYRATTAFTASRTALTALTALDSGTTDAAASAARSIVERSDIDGSIITASTGTVTIIDLWADDQSIVLHARRRDPGADTKGSTHDRRLGALLLQEFGPGSASDTAVDPAPVELDGQTWTDPNELITAITDGRFGSAVLTAVRCTGDVTTDIVMVRSGSATAWAEVRPAVPFSLQVGGYADLWTRLAAWYLPAPPSGPTGT